MKKFEEFKRINEESHDESRKKQLESIKRSKIAIYLDENGFRIGHDYVYNHNNGKFIIKDEQTAKDILDLLGDGKGIAFGTGPDELDGFDINVLNKFRIKWQVPVVLELTYNEELNEATIRGNEGLPGEDGEGENYLDKYKRERDFELRNTQHETIIPELMDIQRYLSRVTKGKEERLEKLAEELLNQLYSGVLPEDFEWDIELVKSGRDIKNFLDKMNKKSKKKEEEKEEEEEEKEEEEKEEEEKTPEEIERSKKLAVDKRKIANNIIQGEALNVKSVIEMPECKEEIKKIFGDSDGDRFIRNLIRLTEIGGIMDWFTPIEHKANMMQNHPEGFAGAAHVDWKGKDDDDSDGGHDDNDDNEEEFSMESEEQTPIFRVRGVDFVMLIHEGVKVVYEYLSTPGISEDPEIADFVRANTSSFADEAEEFKFGPKIAADFRDFINVNNKVDRYPNTKEHIYIKMMMMEDDKFLLLMKGILSSTPSARKQIDSMVDEFISEMEQYEKDLAQWEMDQKFGGSDDEQEEGESEIDKMIRLANTGSEEKQPEAIDPSELSNSEIRELIDDALDAKDFKEVERLSKFIKESKFFRILESYIQKKKK